MKKKRKNYTPQEKVVILKKHLVDQIPVSDLCDQYDLQPTVFYGWQKRFFENGAAAFEKNNSRKESRRILELEKKLQNKNEVVSELMEAHIKLKKVLGNFEKFMGSP
jgi:transposase